MVGRLRHYAQLWGRTHIGRGIEIVFNSLLCHNHVGRLLREGVICHEGVDRCEIVVLGGKTEEGSTDTYVVIPNGVCETIKQQQNDTEGERFLFPERTEHAAVGHIQQVSVIEKWPQDFAYDMHALRHGGEQTLEREGVDVKDIKVKGRWAPDSTAISMYRSRVIPSELLTLDPTQTRKRARTPENQTTIDHNAMIRCVTSWEESTEPPAPRKIDFQAVDDLLASWK
jgi:hypothetical protein